MAENKVTYITTSEHAMVSEGANSSARLEPGERVLFNEESDAHKHIRKLIEAEDESVAHLSLVEVSPKDESKAEEQKRDMLAKANELAAKQREETAREAVEQHEKNLAAQEGQTPHADPTDFPPQDEAAIVLAEEQADQEEQPKAGRRSSKRD